MALINSTTVVTSSANPSAVGQSVTFTATVTGIVVTPTGTVVFKDNGVAISAALTLNGQGKATFTTNVLSAGSHSITAEYNGDLVYNASASSPLTQTVNAAASSTTLGTSVTPSAFTQNVTFTATVSGGSGTPTGTVTFRDDIGILGTSTLNGSGQATYSTSGLLPGNHSITATYNGNATYGTSVSRPLIQQVSIAGTVVHLTATPSPANFGQAVTLRADVDGLIVIPSGSVTFKDGATVLGTINVDLTGRAQMTISTLAVGAHSLTAQYSGDLVYQATNSTPVSLTVNSGTSTTSLTSGPNPSGVGQLVTFTATVAGGSTAPTGTVTFKEGAATLGTGTLSGGQATFSTSALTAGNHTITAQYGGDASYSASTSSPLVQTVNASSSATTLQTSQTPTALGQAVTFTATVVGPGGTPTGTVTFKDGGNTLGTGAVNGSGQATLTTSALNAGAHSITASYGGDATYGASVSPAITQTVTQSTTTVALQSSQNPSTENQLVTFTATVSGSGGTPTGIITFKDGSSTLGTGILNGAGQATFATTGLAPGAHAITAAYGGDTNFTPATSPGLTQTVNPASGPTKTATATTLGSSGSPAAAGQPVTFSVTVTGAGGTPSGTVTFLDGSASIGSTTLNGSGQGTLTTTALTAGSHSITAVYGGDTTFASSASAPFTQVITGGDGGPAASNTSMSAFPSAPSAGQIFALIINVTGSSGTPTGIVTIKDGASTLGTAPLDLAGNAIFPTSLPAGAHTLTGNYGGDSTYAASTSAPMAMTISSTPSGSATTTNLSATPNPAIKGDTVTFTATVSGSGGPPTGTVTFKDGSAVLGSGTLTNGIASFATSGLSIGRHSITAVYGGDGTFAASTSSALALAINEPRDSTRLRTLMTTVAKIAAQNSGDAVTGAISGAISEALLDQSDILRGSDSNIRMNFAGEQKPNSRVQEGWRDVETTSADLRFRPGYPPPGYPQTSYPPPPQHYYYVPPPVIRERPSWLPWFDVRGFGWSANSALSDLKGSQTNAIGGLSRRVGDSFVIGLLGAYETFNFRSTSLDGRVRGDGWSLGVYTGWKISRGLLLEGAFANTSVKYDGQSGTAAGSTTGNRWLIHGALTGRWEMDRLEIEPSLRTFAQTETDKAYTDSLCTPQPERKFTAGRTSAGVKFGYRIGALGETIVTPYVGIYEDYYFTSDSNAAELLLPEFYQGLSTRLTAGIGLSMPSGIKGSFGGEVGGIGSNTFNVWSVRGRLAFPF